ncbi:YwaF family protein [Finegoldia magna]|uniref:YwaF family protein n=1 Tax=Finegoldia magna TaxID=1260 RepID=UPI0028FF00E4|nr:YwaF family protein [Finegoldia magna]MDU1214087.1 YwaF family protein [Finegoldia magna]
MTEFFRYTEDAYTNINITLLRLSLVVVIFLAYKSKHKTKLLKPALILGLCGQILLFSWYVGNHALFIKEGLPLFHCRISAIMMLVAYILHNDKLMRYFAWMGLIGSIIAFTFPDPSKYMWPHVTNLTYIANHLLLGFCGVSILATRKSTLKLKHSLIITTIMNALIMTVNLILHTNYGYLVQFPQTIPVRFTPHVTFLIMTLIITFLITIAEITHIKIVQNTQIEPQLTTQQ